MLWVSVIMKQYDMCCINPTERDLGISCNIIAHRLYLDMYAFYPADGALIAWFIITCIDWPSFSSDTSLILIHACSRCVGFISFAVFYSKHSYLSFQVLKFCGWAHCTDRILSSHITFFISYLTLDLLNTT